MNQTIETTRRKLIHDWREISAGASEEQYDSFIKSLLHLEIEAEALKVEPVEQATEAAQRLVSRQQMEPFEFYKERVSAAASVIQTSVVAPMQERIRLAVQIARERCQENFLLTNELNALKEQKHDHSECKFSTGICGSLTMGQGRLSDNGYWERPCPDEALHVERMTLFALVREAKSLVAMLASTEIPDAVEWMKSADEVLR